METPTLEWNPVQKMRAPAIPKDFEDKLESILREKYLHEDWSLSDVRRYIQDKYDLIINDRQINHRLVKYDMLKKNRRSRPQYIQVLNCDRFGDFEATNLDIIECSSWIPEEFKDLSNVRAALGTLDLPAMPETLPFNRDQVDISRCQETSAGQSLVSELSYDAPEVAAADEDSQNLGQVSITGGLSSQLRYDMNSHALEAMPVGTTNIPATVSLSNGTVITYAHRERADDVLMYQDPTLLDTPTSSLSGFKSMKSVSARAEEDIKRPRGSLSSRNSLYMHGPSVDQSDRAYNLTNPRTSRPRKSVKIVYHDEPITTSNMQFSKALYADRWC